MANWNKTCYSFKNVRNMLNENIETPQHCINIMYKIECCCDELTPNTEHEWIFYDCFRDLKSEIHDVIEEMDEDNYEECENIVNNYLAELYDLCDCAKVWLA